MHNKLAPFLTAAGAAALLVLAMTLGPTTIGSQEPHDVATTAAHSWLSDAFPTGQAGFARATDGGH